jgi:hypothetical protein
MANLSKPVVQIALDPNPQPRLQAVGGGQDDRWNDSLILGLGNALPGIHRPDRAAVANAAIAGLIDIKPSDAVEGMIAGQMIAAHEAALNIYARAWNPNQSFELRSKYLVLADKAARTVAFLSEALDRHRGRGQQTVVVKHVTVNADQAVVTDQVVTTGGGVKNENDKRPNAQAAIAHASSSPMPCAWQENRQTVPVTRDAERSLQAARRQVAKASKGKSKRLEARGPQR